MRYEKVTVEILARFLKDGGLRPVEILWSDGRRYPVSRVRYVERAPAHVGAVLPVRYTCVVEGREKLLWYEPDKERWFVEVMGP